MILDILHLIASAGIIICLWTIIRMARREDINKTNYKNILEQYKDVLKEYKVSLHKK